MSTAADIARATKWNREHIERRREISRNSWRKIHGDPETEMERFERSIERITESGCWIWSGALGQDGYGKTSSKGKDIRAHRWAWHLFKGAIPEGMQVCHRCDVPTCCNPGHLFVGSHMDNERDKRAKGRDFKLPPHRETKLTEKQVAEIRAARGNVRQVDLAKRYGVHHSHISRIQTGDSWNNASDQTEVTYVCT